MTNVVAAHLPFLRHGVPFHIVGTQLRYQLPVFKAFQRQPITDTTVGTIRLHIDKETRAYLLVHVVLVVVLRARNVFVNEVYARAIGRRDNHVGEEDREEEEKESGEEIGIKQTPETNTTA